MMVAVLLGMIVFSLAIVLMGWAMGRSSRTGCCNCRRAQSVMIRFSKGNDCDSGSAEGVAENGLLTTISPRPNSCASCRP